MGLQNRSSSQQSSPDTYRTYAIKWASLATSVASSSCKAIFPPLWSQRVVQQHLAPCHLSSESQCHWNEGLLTIVLQLLHQSLSLLCLPLLGESMTPQWCVLSYSLPHGEKLDTTLVA